MVLAAPIVADPAIALELLLAIGVGAALSMLYYLCSERSMRFVHGILHAHFAFFALWWNFPWAIVTVRSRSWLTSLEAPLHTKNRDAKDQFSIMRYHYQHERRATKQLGAQPAT